MGIPVSERILRSISVTPDGCWEWTKRRNEHGYGNVSVGSAKDGTNRVKLAHRVSYECFVGPIPDGLTIDHLCRNRACVNPEHLEPVTHRVNVLRGTAQAAFNARKTHCLRGHEFTPENTYWQAGGRKRSCRVCIQRRAAERAARRAA